MLKILSYICYIFAVIDFGLFYLIDIDITGVSWSPYVAGLVVAGLGWLGGDRDELWIKNNLLTKVTLTASF